VKFINAFEQTAAEIGISNQYDFVICGHIHQPEIREIKTDKGSITYMNSGDWIENLTSLEYNDGKWSIYKYHEDAFAQAVDLSDKNYATLNKVQLFENLVEEFNLMKRA
jgi:hypothetical protein